MGIDSVGSGPSSPPVVSQPAAPPPPAAAAPAPEAARPVATEMGHVGASSYANDSKISPMIGKSADPVIAAALAARKEKEAAEARNAAAADAAKANYGKNGDTVFDLNTQAGREGLVIQSPQIDNLDGTRTDGTRCGGAALTNAMLLDGDPKANAAALTRMKTEAEKNGAVYPKEQQDAVKAMSTGKMTPNQSAHLQEFMMTTARHQPERPKGSANVDGGGITAIGMANTVAAINANGGLQKSGNVDFNGEVRKNPAGKEYNHWTMTSRDKSLTPTTVDSMPNEYGQQQMKRGSEPEPLPSWVKNADGQDVPNPKFMAQVTLYPKRDGEKASMVDVRTSGVEGSVGEGRYAKHYRHIRMDVTPGKPDQTTFIQSKRDKDTHEILQQQED